MKPYYEVLENGNYLVSLIDTYGFPMFIEMTREEYTSLYGS
jgi:hypothetical protein